MTTAIARRLARVSAVALIAAILAVAGASAKADPPSPGHWLYDRAATAPFERGQVYAAFTLSGGVQQLPRFNTTTSIFNGGTAGFFGAPAFSPEVTGVAPGGEIGYASRDGTFPAWMGRRVRLGLYGSAFHGERTETNNTAFQPNDFFVFYGVDGRRLFAGTIVVPGTYAETLKLQRDAFQVGLKLETDLALGPGLSLTPGVAVFGGRMRDRTVVTGGVFASGLSPYGLDQRLRTTEIGGHVAARLTWQVSPGWALHFGGTAGPVWLSTSMSGTNCFSFNSGNDCTAPQPGAFSATASDSASTVGFRATASAGLAVDLRYATLSLGAFARYDSRLPGIVNPQLANPFAGAVVLPPARIAFDDGFAYGGFLTLRVPLH